MGIRCAHFYWYLTAPRPSQWTKEWMKLNNTHTHTHTHTYFHEVILILQIPTYQTERYSFQFSPFWYLISLLWQWAIRLPLSLIYFSYFPLIPLYITNLSPLPIPTLPNLGSNNLCEATPSREAFIPYPFAIQHSKLGFSHHPTHACIPFCPASPLTPCTGVTVASLPSSTGTAPMLPNIRVLELNSSWTEE